jgi:hypothetical protein
MSKEINRYSLNIASRPFVNTLIPALLMVAAIIVLVVFTIFNAVVLFTTQTDEIGLSQQIEESTTRMDSMRAKIAELDEKLRQLKIADLRMELGYASDLITRRSLSWTKLFDRLEMLAPQELRMIRISPEVRNDVIVMNWRVDVPDQSVIRRFIDDLEESPYFDDVILASESSSPGGGILWDMRLEYREEQ